MPRANVQVDTTKLFTNAIKQPDIPSKFSLHEDAVSLFHAAPNGVSFTGCVNFKSGVVYLAPLQADVARGNVEIGVTKSLSHNAAGNLDSFAPKPQHLLHPNLSPQGRALAGETSGHTKICLKYGLNEDDCVGFAVSKEDGSTRFTCNSRTLNTEKFRTEHTEVKNVKSQILKNLMLKNMGIDSKPSDGLLSKKWAYAIAVAVEMAFIHCLKNPKGHYEAPF